MYALSYYLVRRFYVFQAWLLIATGGAVAATLVAALSGVDVARCLVILMLAPMVTVVGSEVQGAETRSSEELAASNEDGGELADTARDVMPEGGKSRQGASARKTRRTRK
jgi:hypothetical protein